ncbi:TetR/AcrR family transcriptional regulator [Actinomadura rugatobispora]|uniref:TetR/AcrR family transcriptional regulator n=1 Tax=Actinomadura rugatobispora TaxID=1994 RepID=A0ABW0ZR77_9ACTN|nr:TetR/AcrR family transcriptional regulator [Actinomadura rugatobispora]
MDAFAQTGFYGATMKDVARRAGISYTGLMHHFPSKEDLLIAVLEFRGEQSTRLMEAAGARDPVGQPLKALEGLLAVSADNSLSPGLLELHCVISGEATSPEHPAHAYYTERYRKLRQFFTAAFTALGERGELRSPVPAETLATMTLALLNGLQAQWLYDRDTVDIQGGLRAFLASVVPALAE